MSGSVVNIPFPCPCSSVLLQHIITMATAHLIFASQVYCVRFDQILYTQIMFYYMWHVLSFLTFFDLFFYYDKYKLSSFFPHVFA